MTDAGFDGLPPLRSGVAGGTDDATLVVWESVCGHRFPSRYREFVKVWAGARFVEWASFIRPGTGRVDQIDEWHFVVGPSIGTEEQQQRAKSLARGSHNNTMVLRSSLVADSQELAGEWAPSIVAFANMLGARRWLAFDFAFDSHEPAVITYDDQAEWDLDPNWVVDFVAPSFDDFLHMLTASDIQSTQPPAPTEASQEWIAHFQRQLGHRTFEEAAIEIARRASL